ncbi:MAG TPA: 50S ribosomal protein L25 [Patescibacteria group bacterium]
MESTSLSVATRQTTGKKVKDLRKKGLIPGVVYGPDLKPRNLKIDYNSFEKIYDRGGYSILIDLKIDDQPESVKVLITELQKDPVTDKFTHVDFHQVRLTEKLITSVKLKFIGQSDAVKGLGGTLVTNLSDLEIRCLPQDLVSEIEVDISTLKTFEDVVRIKDLQIPANIEVMNNPEASVAAVVAPRTEEELKALEEAPEEKVGEVEVEGEQSAEGGEAAGEEEKAEVKPEAAEGQKAK